MKSQAEGIAPGWSLVFLLFPVAALAGCGAGFTMHMPDGKVVPARTVMVSSSAVGFLVDADNEHLEEKARTEVLEHTYGAELERQGKAKGFRPVPFDKVTACGANCVSLLSTTIRWGEKSAIEIAARQRGFGQADRKSVGEWRSPRDLRPLRKAMDADFGWVSYVRDVHWTGGKYFDDGVRRSNWLVETVRTHHQEEEIRRMLVVCAVEFESGRIAWCASRGDRIDQTVDITSPEEARRLVKDLLAEF